MTFRSSNTRASNYAPMGRKIRRSKPAQADQIISSETVNIRKPGSLATRTFRIHRRWLARGRARKARFPVKRAALDCKTRAAPMLMQSPTIYAGDFAANEALEPRETS